MNIVPLKSRPDTIDEITVGIGDSEALPVSFEHASKHEYHCRIGKEAFLFRSAWPAYRQSARGIGLEMRHTNQDDVAALMDVEDLAGRPGVIHRVEFETPVHVHIERMDPTWYWCSIGGHEFSIKRPGSTHGIELIARQE